MRFPDNFGQELAGLTFDEVFLQHPKWIAFVSNSWTNDCTGLFLHFLRFVRAQLSDDGLRASHEARCRAFVRTLEAANSKIPSYLAKYTS